MDGPLPFLSITGLWGFLHTMNILMLSLRFPILKRAPKDVTVPNHLTFGLVLLYMTHTIRSLINEHARKLYNSGFSRVHGPIYVVVSLINVHPLFNGCTFIPGCSFIREWIVWMFFFESTRDKRQAEILHVQTSWKDDVPGDQISASSAEKWQRCRLSLFNIGVPLSV